MSPLSNIKILDLSRVLAGPWASQILADLGAEVVKIERPILGDETRSWGPPFLKDNRGFDTTESAYFICANRGKKSVCADLKTLEGQRIVRELSSQSDVVIENFKVGGAKQLGLDYLSLSKRNPKLVYCSITGFGQNGPRKNQPGYDFLIQALGGLMSITGQPDGLPGAGPQKVGVALTDVMTGLYAVIGIMSALHERERSGKGQWVNLSLFDVCIATLANQASNYLLGGPLPERLGNAHPNIVPYQSFVVADGEIIITVGNDAQFERFATEIDCPELASNARYATNSARVKNRDELIPIIQGHLIYRKKDELLEKLKNRSVPAGPINAINEVFAEPQLEANRMKVHLRHPLNESLEVVGNPIKFSRTPIKYSAPPPRLGEHTDEILSSINDPEQSV